MKINNISILWSKPAGGKGTSKYPNIEEWDAGEEGMRRGYIWFPIHLLYYPAIKYYILYSDNNQYRGEDIKDGSLDRYDLHEINGIDELLPMLDPVRNLSFKKNILFTGNEVHKLYVDLEKVGLKDSQGIKAIGYTNYYGSKESINTGDLEFLSSNYITPLWVYNGSVRPEEQVFHPDASDHHIHSEGLAKGVIRWVNHPMAYHNYSISSTHYLLYTNKITNLKRINLAAKTDAITDYYHSMDQIDSIGSIPEETGIKYFMGTYDHVLQVDLTNKLKGLVALGYKSDYMGQAEITQRRNDIAFKGILKRLKVLSNLLKPDKIDHE